MRRRRGRRRGVVRGEPETLQGAAQLYTSLCWYYGTPTLRSGPGPGGPPASGHRQASGLKGRALSAGLVTGWSSTAGSRRAGRSVPTGKNTVLPESLSSTDLAPLREDGLVILSQWAGPGKSQMLCI
jgi:hypothetical protein